MSFHTARALHMIAVPFLLVVNWFLIPVSIVLGTGGGIMDKIKHAFDHYVLAPGMQHVWQGYLVISSGKANIQHSVSTMSPQGTIRPNCTINENPDCAGGLALVLIAISGIVLYRVIGRSSAPDWVMDSFSRMACCTFVRFVFTGIL